MWLFLDRKKLGTIDPLGRVIDDTCDTFLDEVLKRRKPCELIKILSIQTY